MSNWYVQNFSALIAEIEQELKRFIQTQPRTAALLWEMIDHHFGWLPNQPKQQSGKRLRPVLALMVGQAVTNGEYHHVMPAAAGIELIHNFTLIHDDVMDKSLERRHRATVWSIWGENQAINAGDGLYSLGLLSATEVIQQGIRGEKAVELMSILLRACLSTVEGQVLDLGFEQRTEVSPAEYLTMIEYKTGRLIQASALAGALLSTDDRAVVAAYGEFALNLGIAFQIQDDYLGIWGDESDTGKSATSDIKQKKKSYPILYMFHHLEDERRPLLTTIYAKPKLLTEDVLDVMEMLEAVNAKERTRQITEDYYQKALAALDRTAINNPYQQKIRDLAAFFVQRAY